MRIAIMSDLHLDHYNNGCRRFAEHLDSLKHDGYLEPADVCVLAGDLADGRFPDMYEALFEACRNHYRNVVVVTGNHDYYKAGAARCHRSIEVAISGLRSRGVDGVHFLNNSSVSIDGRLFHGGTMWYPEREDNVAYEHWMNDVHYIPDFKPWVYEQNTLFQHYARGKVGPTDVVVTHHLPSPKSTPRRFHGSALNRFFVCDMERLIEERCPALWIHGHTHDGCDYVLDQTRVVCNPRGYPRESAFGPIGYAPKVVEV